MNYFRGCFFFWARRRFWGFSIASLEKISVMLYRYDRLRPAHKVSIICRTHPLPTKLNLLSNIRFSTRCCRLFFFVVQILPSSKNCQQFSSKMNLLDPGPGKNPRSCSSKSCQNGRWHDWDAWGQCSRPGPQAGTLKKVYRLPCRLRNRKIHI